MMPSHWYPFSIIAVALREGSSALEAGHLHGGVGLLGKQGVGEPSAQRLAGEELGWWWVFWGERGRFGDDLRKLPSQSRACGLPT